MATAFVNTAGPSNTHTHSLPLFSVYPFFPFGTRITLPLTSTMTKHLL